MVSPWPPLGDRVRMYGPDLSALAKVPILRPRHRELVRAGQGHPLVHFPPQPELLLSLNSTDITQVSLTKCSYQVEIGRV
jgi:hypothetical protein